MSDKGSDNRRSSYGYQKAGDLPGDMGDFYKDAWKAKRGFGKAHDAQSIAPSQTPKQFKSRAGHDLPQPHPSFALPARQAPDENWFQKLVTSETGKALTYAEITAARAAQKSKRRRSRSR